MTISYGIKFWSKVASFSFDVHCRWCCCCFVVLKDWALCIEGSDTTTLDLVLQSIVHARSKQTCQWVQQRFGLTKEQVVDNKLLSRVATRNGSLTILKWIQRTFGLKSGEVEGDEAVLWKKGQMKSHLLLMWWYGTFHSGERSTRNAKTAQEAYLSAAAAGDVTLLNWLHSVFCLKAKVIHTNSSSFLSAVVRSGNVEVLQWVHQTFHLTAQQVKARGNLLLRQSAKRGVLPFLQWLHQTFGVTLADALSKRLLCLSQER